MSSSNHPVNSPRRTFENICKEYNLTSEDLSTLRAEVDRILPEILKDADIPHDLTWDSVLTLEGGLGETSIPKLIGALEKSKTRPLANVLFALGIRHVGGETADLLVRRFNSIDALAHATEEELMGIEGIGPKVAASIASYFADEDNLSVLERMRHAGVVLEQTPTPAASVPLEGKEFVFTGRLEHFTRTTAEGLVKKLGATAGSNVTKKTSYVVLGEDPGSKAERAQQLGVTQLDEQGFLRLLEEVGQQV